MRDDKDEIIQLQGDHDQIAGYFNTFVYNAREFFTKQKKQSNLFREAANIFHDGRELLSERDAGARPVFFMVAAESAYLAAATLSAAMVTLETWKPLRGCLESAVYGFYIHQQPDRWKAWLATNNDPKAERALGYEFSFSTICREYVKPKHRRLGEVAEALYRESIRRGAHFNQSGFRSNLTKLDLTTRRGKFSVIGGDTGAILYTWRKTLEAAHASLRLFDVIFSDRWSDAGISSRIYELQESVRKLPKGSI